MVNGSCIVVTRWATVAALIVSGLVSGSLSAQDSLPAALDSEPLTVSLNRATAAVRRSPESPAAWYRLGASRADLALTSATARAGPLQPAGAGFAVGAVNALLRALELDSTFVEAAVMLAAHPGLDGWEIGAPGTLMAERLAALRHTTLPDSISAAAWLGRAELESQVGDLDSAAAYLDRYVASGGDPGIGGYRLARVRFRLGDSAGAVAAYYAGARVATSSRAAALYRRDISWVADSAEVAQYDSVAAGEREQWLRAFWGIRDAEAARQSGERLVEHFRRYEYAFQHFRITPSLQRRRAGSASTAVASLGGVAPAVAPTGHGSGTRPADDGEATPRPDEARDATPANARRVGGAGGGTGALSSDWDDETISWLSGASSYFSHFVSSQQILDHRGVVYMRHGPPDRRAISVSEGETWYYALTPAPLLFHFADAPFDGSTGNTTLVAVPANLESMCGIDTELCLLGMAQVGTTARPAAPLRATQLSRQVDRGKEWIRQGTASDSYVPRFAVPLEPVVQLFALHGRPADRSMGRVLIVFAVRGAGLDGDPLAGDPGRFVYPLEVRVTAATKQGAFHSRDTLRTFVTQRRLGEDEYLLGHLELALPPDRYTVAVRLEQQDSATPRDDVPGRRPGLEAERGAIVRLAGVDVPARDDRLSLSDIVLGRAGSGLTWWSGSETIHLNPLNAVTEGATVQLYYEAAGLRPGAEYRTRVSLYRRGDERRRPLLTLTFTERAATPLQMMRREVDLGRLDDGSYDLEVEVGPTDGSRAPVRRQVVLNVIDR